MRRDDEFADQLGGGAPQQPKIETTDAPPPFRAFLRSITVSGFRGIGGRATLEVNPYRGITVISGRNGSGKSSFAEALEYALTGTSCRWEAKKGQHWQASWRNLHVGEPASIKVDFAMEPDDDRTGTIATVGVDWPPDCNLNAAERWPQIKGQKRGTVAALGWISRSRLTPCSCRTTNSAGSSRKGKPRCTTRSTRCSGSTTSLRPKAD
jgi:hypothetical protein